MPHKRCLLHANCHGEELEPFLMASKAFSEQYLLRRYTSYIKEAVPDGALAHCDLFLFQYLDAKWENLSSAALLKKLPATCTAICIPNPRFLGYWPLWTGEKVLDFGDKLLNRLLDEDTPKETILKLYLHGDLEKFVDIQGVLAHTLAMERAKEKICCVQYVDFLLERWQHKPMFYTAHHPAYDLLLRTANAILERIGLPRLTRTEIQNIPQAPFPTYSVIQAPIHPQVVKALNLTFIKPGQKYTILSRRFNFEEFTHLYIDACKLGRAGEFLRYVQQV